MSIHANPHDVIVPECDFTTDEQLSRRLEVGENRLRFYTVNSAGLINTVDITGFDGQAVTFICRNAKNPSAVSLPLGDFRVQHRPCLTPGRAIALSQEIRIINDNAASGPILG